MSTPSRFLKSRMWPTDAFTVNPDPRYLPIVRALAGDSTTTSAEPGLTFFGFLTTSTSSPSRDFASGLLAFTGGWSLVVDFAAAALAPGFAALFTGSAAAGLAFAFGLSLA